MPFLGNPSCRLLVQPLVIVPVAPFVGRTVTTKLPLGTPFVTVFAQAATHYFTTIGFTDDYELSAGLSITLR